ncbi:MAG: hypothetical protein IH851_01590 [Armatimonadetes bacterium]|nr:hypothetical protein [Armatimonadota bacterium]
MITSARRKANLLFVLGWGLTLLNLAGVLWAIYLPIKLRLLPEQLGGLFYVSNTVEYAFWTTASIAALVLIALAQILFISRLVARMVADLPEIAGAEAALKLAWITAWLTILFCTLSFLYDLRTYRQWQDSQARYDQALRP